MVGEFRFLTIFGLSLCLYVTTAHAMPKGDPEGIAEPAIPAARDLLVAGDKAGDSVASVEDETEADPDPDDSWVEIDGPEIS